MSKESARRYKSTGSDERESSVLEGCNVSDPGLGVPEGGYISAHQYYILVYYISPWLRKNGEQGLFLVIAWAHHGVKMGNKGSGVGDRPKRSSYPADSV